MYNMIYTFCFAAALLEYCRKNPDVIASNPINCAQYFDCSAKSLKEGTFLRECPYPMLFSDVTKTCQNFTDVQCGRRMEPTDPCMYSRAFSCTPVPCMYSRAISLSGYTEYSDRHVCANSTDHNQTAPKEQFHQRLHCLSVCQHVLNISRYKDKCSSFFFFFFFFFFFLIDTVRY